MPPKNPTTRREIAAGGVVFQRAPEGLRVALAERTDWRTQQPTTCLPKGHPEEGENLAAAALREVREETGLEARILAALQPTDYAFEHPRGFRVEKRVHFFLMEYVAGTPAPADGEMERVYWCPPESAAHRLSFASERAALAEACRLYAEHTSRL